MKKNGFTLIELIVAMGIFSIVMIMALGSIFSLVDVNQRVQSNRKNVDNLDFVLDDIKRNAVLSQNYHCFNASDSFSPVDLKPRDCPGGGTAIAFLNAGSGNVHVYRFMEAGGVGFVEASKDGVNFSRITEEGIDIKLLNFVVIGSEYRDNIKSTLYVRLSGQTTDDDAPSINLQTMVSQRASDF